MKNRIKLIPALAAIILMTSCTAAGKGGLDTGTEAVAEAQTSSEAVTAAQTTAQAPESTFAVTEAPAVTADKFVTMKSAENGTINYPVFSVETLDADDAAAANALFEHIKDMLLADAEELAQLEPDISEGIEPPFSVTHTSLYDGTLSVIMEYKWTFGFLGVCYKAVNFDISTGKAVGLDELLKAASLTESDAENSVLWYTKVHLLNRRDENYIIDRINEGTLPEFYSHDGLFNDEKVICEIALDNFRSCVEYSDIGPEGMPWERLPLGHTAYINGEGQLYVFGTVAPDGQIAGKMAAIADSDENIAEANLHNEFGAMQRKHYIMPEDVSRVLDSVVDPEILPEYRVEGITEIFCTDTRSYAYTVNVFSDTGFAPALVDRYAVDLFDGYIWRTGDDGQWEMID